MAKIYQISINNDLAICNIFSFNRAFNNRFIFDTHTCLPQGRIYSFSRKNNESFGADYDKRNSF